MTAEMRLSIYTWLFQLRLRLKDELKVFLYCVHILDLFLSQPEIPPTFLTEMSHFDISTYTLAAYYLAQMSINTPLGMESDFLYQYGDGVSHSNFHDAMRHILTVISFDLHQRNMFYYLKCAELYLTAEELVTTKVLLPYVILTTVCNNYSELDVIAFCGELAISVIRSGKYTIDNTDILTQFRNELGNIVRCGHSLVLIQLFSLENGDNRGIEEETTSILSRALRYQN